MTRDPRRLALILTAFVLAAVLAPLFVAVAAQSPATLNPANPFKPTPCTPLAQLKGKDTLLAILPCNSLTVLHPDFRAVVECTMGRLKAGGWNARVYETYRSDTRQRFLYSYGRTRPGHRVTNARTAQQSAHGQYRGVDIIDAVKGWENPRLFVWIAKHGDACGAEAGRYWKSFPDPPHLQDRAWRKVTTGTTAPRASRVTRAAFGRYASLHRGSYETSPNIESARPVALAGGDRVQSGSHSAPAGLGRELPAGDRQRASAGAARRTHDGAAGRGSRVHTSHRLALPRAAGHVTRLGGDRLPTDRATRSVRYATNPSYLGRLAGTIPTSECDDRALRAGSRDHVPIVTLEERQWV